MHSLLILPYVSYPKRHLTQLDWHSHAPLSTLLTRIKTSLNLHTKSHDCFPPSSTFPCINTVCLICTSVLPLHTKFLSHDCLTYRYFERLPSYPLFKQFMILLVCCVTLFLCVSVTHRSAYFILTLFLNLLPSHPYLLASKSLAHRKT